MRESRIRLHWPWRDTRPLLVGRPRTPVRPIKTFNYGLFRLTALGSAISGSREYTLRECTPGPEMLY